MRQKVRKGGGERYYDCILVSLLTAKKLNPADDVALITTVEPPQYLTDIFQKHGVRVIIYPFDSFLFDESDPWQLAYYKLSALKNAVESLDYDNYLLLDADTVIQGTLVGVWADCKNDLLLYPLAHGHNHPEMLSMRETSEKLYGNLYNMIHYGGEFIAGNRENLKDFLGRCEVIYNDMVKKSVRTTQGDEFLISLAATQKRDNIRPATPYVRREWTGRYYDCSTAYRFTDIPIFHLPAGKESTFAVLSAYYQKHGTFPKNQYDYYCLPKCKTPLRYFIYKAITKIKSQ